MGKPTSSDICIRQSRQHRSDEQRRMEQEAQAAAQRERRADLTDEQRRVEQDIPRHHLRGGGVVSADVALSLVALA